MNLLRYFVLLLMFTNCLTVGKINRKTSYVYDDFVKEKFEGVYPNKISEFYSVWDILNEVNSFKNHGININDSAFVRFKVLDVGAISASLIINDPLGNKYIRQTIRLEGEFRGDFFEVKKKI